MRLSFTAVMLFSMAVVAPASARAQNSAEPAVAALADSLTPSRLDAKQVGITRTALDQHTRRAEAADAPVLLQGQSRSARGRTLMIVGGAAFLAGLLIGDDAGNAVAIGGAVIGIYGLYLWAQTQ
jgi:hypothetical protein